MSKRRSENGQMRREDYEAREDDVSSDSFDIGFQRASDESIRQRKIVKARVSAAPAAKRPPPAASATSASNSFGGFQGLTASASAPPKANPFAGFSGLTTQAPAAPVASQPTTTNGWSSGTAPVASAGASKPSTSAPTTYQDAIEVLNKEFLAFVSEQAKEHPSASWTAAVQDYLKHAEQIATKFASTRPVPIDSQGKRPVAATPASTTTMLSAPDTGTITTPSSGFIASSAALSSASSTFSFGTKKDEQSATKPAATSGFTFGSSSAATKSIDSAKPSATPAFSFGSSSTNSPSTGSKAPAPAPSSGFSFGGSVPAPKSSAPTGGFSFGSNSSSSTSSTTSAAGNSISGATKPFNFNLAPSTSTFGAAPATSTTGSSGAGASTNDDDENIGREEPTVILKSDSSDDDIVFDVEKAKIFEFKKDEKRWADKGVHPLQVLVNKNTKKARILARNQIGKIVLNSSLYKGMSIKPHEAKGKKTGAIISLQVEGVMTQFLLKVNPEKVDPFITALESAATSC